MGCNDFTFVVEHARCRRACRDAEAHHLFVVDLGLRPVTERTQTVDIDVLVSRTGVVDFHYVRQLTSLREPRLAEGLERHPVTHQQ
jgi:hypothetical protein